MHTGLLSENPSAVNLLTGPTNCGNLQKRTFILRFNHSDIDRVRGRPF